MPNSALQTAFRDETIAGFEKNKSLLSQTVTTEYDVRAGNATFLVADSGGRTATTRGLNGLIPAGVDNLNQYTVPLTEWHDKVIRTSYNLWASQGDGQAIMQRTVRAGLNRKRDEDIIAALSTSTQLTPSAGVAANLSMIAQAKTILGNNFASGGDVYGVITSAFHGHLMKLREFTSTDWVDGKKYERSEEDDMNVSFEWYGVKWIVNDALPGVNTPLAKCYMYNKRAVGHACDTDGMTVEADYRAEQNYSWAMSTAYMGTALLQQAGVVTMPHDDSLALL